MAERLIPFPFQKKELQDGEKLPVVDRVMEESKTIDKWQLVAGTAMALASPLVPVLAPAAAGMIGGSIVSHEIGRDELRIRREKRKAKQLTGELPKAA